MSESYYFALCPRYLKVDHSFAKNIVPGTRYRLAVFKGKSYLIKVFRNVIK